MEVMAVEWSSLEYAGVRLDVMVVWLMGRVDDDDDVELVELCEHWTGLEYVDEPEFKIGFIFIFTYIHSSYLILPTAAIIVISIFLRITIIIIIMLSS